MSIFNHLDYRAYLEERASQHGRGARAQWAEAMGVQKGYLTQVLKGSAHLSLEQVDRLSEHLGLSEGEKDYFLLLVQLARAGSKSLEDHFQKKLKEARERQLSVRKRFREDQKLTLHDQMVFYSNWRYAAIHIALGIKSLQTPEALSEALHISIGMVREALEFLLSSGLAEVDEHGFYSPRANQSFLSGESPLIQKHHLNWRIKAMQNLERNRADELHYSAVISVSKEDRETLQHLFLEMIADFKEVVKKSSSETEVQVLTLDFFSLFGES